ncbi:MAG: VCBS repeat-containing protein [Chloroflexi bacterium]|nr:VCBS repeat-containing protein [Chloroflexota bacterium]
MFAEHPVVDAGAATQGTTMAENVGDAPGGPPSLPAAFWGSTHSGGAQVPAGIPVSVWINRQRVARTQGIAHDGQSVYALDVPAGDGSRPGGQPGDEVRFRIGNLWAYETSIWMSGQVLQLALTAPAFGTRFGDTQNWSTAPLFRNTSLDKFPRTLADVNGDGLADAIVIDPTRGIKVSLATGSGFADPVWWSRDKAFRKPSQNLYPRFFADVNGDGLADAILFHKSVGIKVALSNGNAFEAPTWWNKAGAFCKESQDAYPRMLADVNGDGMADAILFHPTSGIKVALSNGSSFAWPVWWSRESAFYQESQNAYPRMLADVNGDGMADAVLFHREEGIRVALSRGDRFAPSTLWSQEMIFRQSSQDFAPRMLADVNGDARADAIVFDPFGGVRVGTSNGAGFEPAQLWSGAFGWGSQELKPRDLGDVNGDGRGDAVGFNPDTGIEVALAQ